MKEKKVSKVEERTAILAEMKSLNFPINYKSFKKFSERNINPSKNRCAWFWKTQTKVIENPGEYIYEQCGLKNTHVLLKFENYYNEIKKFPRNLLSLRNGSRGDSFTICNKHLKKFLGLSIVAKKIVANKNFAQNDFICGYDHLDVSNLFPKSPTGSSNLKILEKKIIASQDIRFGDALSLSC